MLELYTSLKHAKMAMNGGELPPMTPLSERIATWIDPEHVLGMGGLIEDASKGIKCPLRRCEKYAHHLTNHLDRAHGRGTARAVREALDLPRRGGLTSEAAKAAYRRAGPRLRHGAPPEAIRRSIETRKSRGLARRSTASARNLRGQCEAQITHGLLQLAVGSDGLNVSCTVAERAYGAAWVSAAVALFGSWNAAKASCSLATQKQGRSFRNAPKWCADAIYSSYEEFAKAHGRLPTWAEAKEPDRLPLVPVPATVLRILGIDTWPLAMSHVAFVLGIDDPRYWPAALAGQSA